MSNVKRHAKAPTPVEALDHVQEAIVKCLETPDDVVAFLDALSPDALCRPLAALSRLLCEPGDDMWDAGAEAAALVWLWPSFAGLDHVLIGILKWLKTPQEVLAFLEGIDTPTLGKPLVALLRLLRAPLDVVKDVDEEDLALDKLWPVLRLDCVYEASAGLVVEALPAFHAIEMGDPRYVSAFGPSGHAPWTTYLDAFAWFVDTFQHKLTHLQFDDCIFGDDDDAATWCSLLRRCTNLDVVFINDTPHDLALVAAVTTPAHAVSSLTIVSDRTADEWAAVLEPWLQSGHATHLRCHTNTHFGDPHSHGSNVGIARILAAASSLTHLVLIAAMDDLDPLVDASGLHFDNLETLGIHVKSGGDFVQSVLDRVNPAMLTSLAITCKDDDIGFLLDILPRFSVLRELKLCNVMLTKVAQRLATKMGPLALTSLTLHDVSISRQAFLTLSALLANAPDLETLAWGGYDTYYDGDSREPLDAVYDLVPSTFADWIRNGVRDIHFYAFKVPNSFGKHLARALRGATSVSGVKINVVGNAFGDDENEALLDALTTCTGVVLFLNRNWPQLAIEAAKRNLALDDDNVPTYDFDEIERYPNDICYLPRGRRDVVRVMRRLESRVLV